jgi:hypothetical protein
MIFTKYNFSIIFLVIICCGSFFVRPARAQSISDIKLDTHRVAWTRLSFHTKNFWVEVSTDVQLASMPASEIEALLISTPQGHPIRPASSEASQMTINTTIDPKFRSPVNIYNRIWFNPADATALGRIRQRRGEDDFKKIYRFTKQGVFRHRMEPKNKKELSLVPEKWTDINDSFYPYDLDRLGCSGVSERSLPIYILSAAGTSKLEDSLSLCVLGKRQLHRVTLRKAGEHTIDVSFIEKRHEAQVHKTGTVKSIKFTLTSEPMESDLGEPENFSFLGFHKDISIYIDPVTHLPLQASGIIPTVGKANLKLREAHVKRQAQ